MAYATQQDLIDRFGESEVIALTDRSDPPAGAVDAAVAALALSDADSEIDVYVGRRYTLPLEPVPTVLVRVACDIARYRLSDDADVLTEEVSNRYNGALRLLRDLAAGKATLGVAAPPVLDSPRVNAQPRVFTRETLADF